MGVAVHDARFAVVRPVVLQPRGQLGYPDERTRIVGVVAVALQQSEELRNLARQKGTGPAQRGEWAALPVDVAEPGQGGGVGGSDVVPKGRVVDVGLRHL